MTPARKEAFEKCRLARWQNALRPEPQPQLLRMFSVPKNKRSVLMMQWVRHQLLYQTPLLVPRAVVPKKSQPVLKEKKIPQRKNAPKRSALELRGEPHPIVSPDMDTDEDQRRKLRMLNQLR
jgi:hypothetical protein